GFTHPDIGPRTTTYLQYTSGSTSTPKGVMVDHRCLLTQAAYLSSAFEYAEHSAFGSWMPHFHDYHLVEGVIHPLYSGTPVYFMAPQSFVADPLAWLRMISRYRISNSGAPNFAYDLCVRRAELEP